MLLLAVVMMIVVAVVWMLAMIIVMVVAMVAIMVVVSSSMIGGVVVLVAIVGSGSHHKGWQILGLHSSNGKIHSFDASLPGIDLVQELGCRIAQIDLFRIEIDGPSVLTIAFINCVGHHALGK